MLFKKLYFKLGKYTKKNENKAFFLAEISIMRKRNESLVPF